MGIPDKKRIVSVDDNPPSLILEISGEKRSVPLDESAAQSFAEVLSEKPFGSDGSDQHSYWLYGLEYTQDSKFLFFRADPKDFKIAVRIKHGRSRKSVLFSCSATVYQSLRTLFPEA